MKKTVVYGLNFERACDKLQEILDNMRYGDVKRVYRGYNCFTVECYNGDIYIALIAGQSSRGHKWQYAYIDKLIKEKLVCDVILANFVPPFEESKKVTNCYEMY